MMNTIVYVRMEEQKSCNLPDLSTGRENLVHFISSQGAGFVKHLDYVVGFLHRDFDYKGMLEHAESLKTSQAQNYKGDAFDITAKLDEKELPVVREYMEMLAQYARGEADFHSVKVNARKLIRLIPIPDTARIPPDSYFFKGKPGTTLADMREEV